MFELAISQMTTVQWNLVDEVACLVDHGIDALAAWRPKMTDQGLAAAGAILEAAGVRVSSIHWAGGFTGGDGRSFDDSIDDALEAIDMAETLAAGVVVLHSGCRGGHTRSHATRLLWQALEELTPRADRAGVTLAIKPMHGAAATCGSFLTSLTEAVDFVNRFDSPAVRMSFDLWHWADHHALRPILPRIAEVTAVVHVADRIGTPTPNGDRMPPGRGTLPLEDVLGDLMAAGFRGEVEFDPVGQAVEETGYGTVIREARSMAAAWSSRLAAEFSQPVELPRPHFHARHFFRDGSSRSQASSQTVSPG
jgi:sugar phosphate isomerase/epimerase